MEKNNDIKPKNNKLWFILEKKYCAMGKNMVLWKKFETTQKTMEI